jgi:uncharacterized protein with NRDE domain
MCTVLLLLRPDERWPLLVASNRDERLDRAFDPPWRWWPDAPQVLAWRDRTSGGSWLGVNDGGVFATLINHVDELGPLPGKRSRGDLVVEALRRDDAAAAAETIAALDGDAFRGFTLLVADRAQAFTVSNDDGAMRVVAISPGHHMLTPEGCDVPGSRRFDAHIAEFRAAAVPRPGEEDWASWIALLQREDADDPHQAMTVVTDHGFGTVASTLIAVPAGPEAPVVRYADGPPNRAAFRAPGVPGFAA